MHQLARTVVRASASGTDPSLTCMRLQLGDVPLQPHPRRVRRRGRRGRRSARRAPSGAPPRSSALSSTSGDGERRRRRARADAPSSSRSTRRRPPDRAPGCPSRTRSSGAAAPSTASVARTGSGRSAVHASRSSAVRSAGDEPTGPPPPACTDATPAGRQQAARPRGVCEPVASTTMPGAPGRTRPDRCPAARAPRPGRRRGRRGRGRGPRGACGARPAGHRSRGRSGRASCVISPFGRQRY